MATCDDYQFQMGPDTSMRKHRGMDYYGTYIGPSKFLQGCKAMVMETTDPKYCVVQFTKFETGLGYGWWRFKRSDFLVEISEFTNA